MPYYSAELSAERRRHDDAPTPSLTSDDFVALGWLGAGATTLSGTNAHVYADCTTTTRRSLATRSRPAATAAASAPGTGPTSSPRRRATTAPRRRRAPGTATAPNTYQTNLPQNATQVFFFVNAFHDHLAAAPIGFTAANGNFEGVDAVQAQVDDGAGGATPSTPPTAFRTATTSTTRTCTRRPTAVPPRMQMYLFTNWTGDEPFVDSNGGDDASIIYHEYTHGLSNRLVTDAANDPALHGQQSRLDGRGLVRLVRARLHRQGLHRGHAAPDGLLGRRPRAERRGQREPVARTGHRRRPGPRRAHPADRLPGERRRRRLADRRREQRPGLPGRRQRPGRRLHLRRLREDHRRARGARRRRDLGRDAVADPPGDRPCELPGHREPRDPRPRAGAARAVVPGRAQRDPAGRPGPVRRRPHGHAVVGLRRSAGWATRRRRRARTTRRRTPPSTCRRALPRPRIRRRRRPLRRPPRPRRRRPPRPPVGRRRRRLLRRSTRPRRG